jgi:hypothetical protein
MNEIPLVEFYVAYRKAKYEAYRDSNCAHGAKFAAYEARLDENLRLLQQRLLRPDWARDSAFIGGVTYIPKSLDPRTPTASDIHFSFSDPLANWSRDHQRGVRHDASFRPVIDATVDYMVVSALWILQVGHKYDAKLHPRHSVGNRLRRRRPSSHAPGAVGPLNRDSFSLFEFYPAAYRRWRARGLRTMRDALERRKQAIVAMTMDLKQFYHRVDPSFLISPGYLGLCGVALTADEFQFTRRFVHSLETWNASFGETRGLPVGLTASGLIANVLLLEFDRRVLADLRPLYYGRYVDDIFLVLRQKGEFLDGRDVLRWLAERLDGLATFTSTRADGSLIRLRLPAYGRRSLLEFVGKKQKIFLLQGSSGLDLLAPIEEQIRKQSSEHRALPDLPDTESAMADLALLVTSNATLEADGLRKADSVTLRRAGFAILLRDIERHARYVDVASWEDERRHFYGLVSRHLVTPPGFFAYFRYIPRVMALMMRCSDHAAAGKFLRALGRTVKALEITCAASAALRAQLRRCEQNLVHRMLEAIAAEPMPPGVRRRLPALLAAIRKIARPSISTDVRQLATLGRHLREIDWASPRYAEAWLARRRTTSPAPPLPRDAEARAALPLSPLRQLRLAADLPLPRWTALAFPTRPIRLNEILTAAPALLEDWPTLRTLSLRLCGAWLPIEPGIRIERGPSAPDHLHIPLTSRDWTEPLPKIAVTNYKTTLDDWHAAVDGTPNLSLERFRTLSRIVNAVIIDVPRPDYVVLPECCLPRRWAGFIAHRLNRNSVSLIAGLEYRHSAAGLHNEALVSLVTDYAGYRTGLTLHQAKQSPAWRERQDVSRRAGRPVVEVDSFSPPVYFHEDFALGVLICSDLTDIANRAHFRGQVDCLFVPEWNSDLETFAALVESATLDLHAYVAQANNRLYGDGRIRGPYKAAHERDVIRIRGGIHDYVVVGQVDHRALRRFQSRVLPLLGDDELFKPYPIGFEISEQRRIRRRL